MPVARLATADAEGRPHVVPICFVVCDDRLYFVVDDKPKTRPRSLRRLRNIAANAEVAVLVDHYEEDWTRLWFVRYEGRAAPVADAEEYRRVLAALRAKYPQYRAMDLEMASHPMIAVATRRSGLWRA